jgi:hypothetical protein
MTYMFETKQAAGISGIPQQTNPFTDEGLREANASSRLGNSWAGAPRRDYAKKLKTSKKSS